MLTATAEGPDEEGQAEALASAESINRIRRLLEPTARRFAAEFGLKFRHSLHSVVSLTVPSNPRKPLPS